MCPGLTILVLDFATTLPAVLTGFLPFRLGCAFFFTILQSVGESLRLDFDCKHYNEYMGLCEGKQDRVLSLLKM